MNKLVFGQVDTLQQDVDGFLESTTNQGLDINPSKCQIIQFCPKRCPSSSPPSIVLQSHPLTPENSIKILGVWFTSNLKWTVHLDYAFQKCSKAAYFMKLLHKKGIRGVFLHKICNSLVFSHLTYCWPVFCDCTNGELKRFVALENRLCKLSGISSPSNLRIRMDIQCVNLANKIKQHGGHPLEECFTRRVCSSSMDLRVKKKFEPIRSRYALFRNSFTKFAC